MPWSDWQAPEDYDRNAVALRVEADILSHDPSEPGIVQSLIANLDLQSTVYLDVAGYTISRHDLLQFSARTDWQTYRSWFPPLLSTLVEGVDFTIRPDRTPSDDDAYVEYQDGLNENLGWLMPTTTVTSPMSTNDTATGAAVSGSGVGTLEVLPSSYPATAGTSIGPMPTGATILTVGPGDAPSFAPADPGELSFSLVTATGSISIPLNTHIGWTVSLAALPQQHTQSPPWRYWIPESTRPSHVRLLHRTDGLGLGAARLRRRDSHQAGRLRSYY